jgi:Tfp pilus assembly PilM family ATPase
LAKSLQWLAVVRDEHWIAAKVKRNRKKMEICYFAETDIPYNQEKAGITPPNEDDPQDGQENSAHLSDSLESFQQLRAWLKQEKIPSNRLQIAFSCAGVITRVIVLPEMGRKDMNRLLTEQVEQYFTLSIQDYLVDYRILDHFIEDGEARIRVLLAALPKDPWEKFWQTCEKAGLNLDKVDLAIDSMMRLYAWSEELTAHGKRLIRNRRAMLKGQRIYWKNALLKNLPEPVAAGLRSRTRKLKPAKLKKKSLLSISSKRKPKREKTKTASEIVQDTAIVALNQSRAEIVILEQGIFFLYSDLPFQWNPTDMSAKLLITGESSLNMPQDNRNFLSLEMEPMLVYHEPEATTEDKNTMFEETREHSEDGHATSETGDPSSGFREELEEALTPVIRVLMEFINFFAARHFGKPVDAIYLTGEYSDIPVLTDVFTENLGIETYVGFPHDWQPKFVNKAKPKQEHWMKYADLYGLALRGD